MVAVALAVVGLLLVAVVGLAVAWQERRRLHLETVAVYGVEDAIEFIWQGLDGERRHRLGRDGVRRILEWEHHYLQRPWAREGEPPPVVAGADAAAYAQRRAWERGYAYEPEEIFAVLDLEAAYLAAIGAVGEIAAAPEGLTEEEADG